MIETSHATKGESHAS